ncbi:16S rRNA (uracil(1498)-N(3))-methyltransferase [Nocardia seriolae]|uniref:Ribosomal RNA small subunit methyltransferase E n=1 Tax=Nocardia seriolae TaxID=37332 RepID=A0ABC8ASD6_9NOCA|nr:16S rRNA (uracil(1498)-N(3))-methyltransferase [Nocardia seriolae]APA96934.1 16S rRNA (uracil(1498)-N(3))-methyltransferase [Nocardia seriolae]OJF81965.1 16S rRNA (uracil(1498)-N(3))-methyltransferase [Nocardia seriolae]PSK32368.1 16S rRNA (uracil(1498)-N(3))-methyltransferase [Nocardia seriolae]QOW33948.1 16S rRNA (uracil(1498)-N(3))-methyltransferase [Nocardia seriolae]QUN18556.1 16S rRNA (uracil(1498)-N(3))-methyltransferase [Nocardia seriolae]
MAATVFYLDDIPEPGATAVLDGPEGRHAATVRRIRVGEPITLSDGHGTLADSEVVAAAKDRLELKVLSKRVAEPWTPQVTVVQALPKSDRSELAVELMTEAGADAIVPWQALRCVSNWESKARKGVEKWRAAAKQAARQSRRAYIPDVADLHSTKELLELVRTAKSSGAIVAALHESGESRLTELSFDGVPEVILIVGPEGGLDDSELKSLTEAGADAVLLGPTVLRTSTAAAVALGALGALTPRW